MLDAGTSSSWQWLVLVLGTSLELAVGDLVGGVVPVKLVNAAREGEADKQSQDEEAQDVVYQATKSQLQRSEMRADGAEVYELEDADSG